ncbi:MAG TPA: hypothetical protein VMV94_20075 [Phycisphaerae bacterium]|nr:hypothetical protein [Phycisphaerae bacterium]
MIRHAGFNVGTVKVLRLDTGRIVAHVDATSTATGERWGVQAPTEYEAVVELARHVGVKLEHG